MSHKRNARIWRDVAANNRAIANNSNLSPADRRAAAKAAREAERMSRKDTRDAYKRGEYDTR